jgi:hypothetical protein
MPDQILATIGHNWPQMGTNGYSREMRPIEAHVKTVGRGKRVRLELFLATFYVPSSRSTFSSQCQSADAPGCTLTIWVHLTGFHWVSLGLEEF